MADLKVSYKIILGKDFYNRARNNIRQSAMKAANQLSLDIKTQGRNNIKQSYKNMGRIANAFRVNVYPKNKSSFHPAVVAKVKTGYSKIFEEGANIKGKPLLWIPLPPARKLMGLRRVTPSEWEKRYGDLTFIKSNGKSLLVGRYGIKSTANSRAKNPRLVKRAGRTQGQITPLFVGVKSVSIRPEWKLSAIVAKQWSRMPELYKRNMQ